MLCEYINFNTEIMKFFSKIDKHIYDKYYVKLSDINYYYECVIRINTHFNDTIVNFYFQNDSDGTLHDLYIIFENSCITDENNHNSLTNFKCEYYKNDEIIKSYIFKNDTYNKIETYEMFERFINSLIELNILYAHNQK